jgi:hypothetical protein
MNPSLISPKILSKYSVETIDKINSIFLKRIIQNISPPKLYRQKNVIFYDSNPNSPLLSRVNSPSIFDILEKFK